MDYMDLFVSNAPNKSEAFKYMVDHFCKWNGSAILSYEGKRWLFERAGTSLSIRPIHGFVVGLIYKNSDNVKYVTGVTYQPGGWGTCEWSQFWQSSELADAEVFFSASRLDRFLENLKDHFFNVDQGKEMFWVPVSLKNGKAF